MYAVGRGTWATEAVDSREMGRRATAAVSFLRPIPNSCKSCWYTCSTPPDCLNPGSTHQSDEWTLISCEHQALGVSFMISQIKRSNVKAHCKLPITFSARVLMKPPKFHPLNTTTVNHQLD
jgi:hypothetical protein